MIPGVANSAEFQRIATLPRRVWGEADAADLARQMTEILKTPNGTMRLKPIQAIALHDMGVCGGAFCPIGVGGGKTLISLLSPVALGSNRPLLLLPAALIEKTQRERLVLSRHWRIPTIRLLSYEMLGRVQAAEDLHSFRPDAIIADEGHRLKSRRAAVTRRVARFMHDYPHTKFVDMSGTAMSKSILDFAHRCAWCLKTESPLPKTREELEEWAGALDHGVDPMVRRKAGVLLQFANDEEKDEADHVAARKGFCRRLVETPGVVATVGIGEDVGCSLRVTGIMHRVKPITEANFTTLRREWTTPDGWQLSTAVDVWRHAQELAAGLFYAWQPRPPDEWRAARRDWHKFVREIIARGRTYDSELQVANACDAGKLPSRELEAWRKVRPTFVPNAVPVWQDESALEECARWAKSPGLVWTEHAFFAVRLAKETGLPYYGAQGCTADGRYIEDAKPGTSAIASLDANREGRNLQKLWSRNLLVCPPSSGAWWEQVLARTHRIGQPADEVTFDVLLGCRENWNACQKALATAASIQETTGKIQKLTLADITLPTEAEIDSLPGDRWVDVTN